MPARPSCDSLSPHEAAAIAYPRLQRAQARAQTLTYIATVLGTFGDIGCDPLLAQLSEALAPITAHAYRKVATRDAQVKAAIAQCARGPLRPAAARPPVVITPVRESAPEPEPATKFIAFVPPGKASDASPVLAADKAAALRAADAAMSKASAELHRRRMIVSRLRKQLERVNEADEQFRRFVEQQGENGGECPEKMRAIHARGLENTALDVRNVAEALDTAEKALDTALRDRAEAKQALQVARSEAGVSVRRKRALTAT